MANTIPPLSQLLNAQTPAQIQATLLTSLAAAGLPATAWPAISVPTLMVESESIVLGALQQQLVNIGLGGYLQLSASSQLQTGPGGTSPFTDLIAAQQFNLLRNQPQPTIGPFSFTCVNTAGPYSIAAGQLKITDAAGNVFSNQNSFTIPQGGSVNATVQAQSPGSQANIANGTALSLQTSLAGVTVATVPPSGSPLWFTAGQAGTDIESDQSLIARCLNQWTALGTGSPMGAWLNWVFAASNEVRYVNVRATGLGSVAITVYGNDGPVSDTGLALISSYLNPRIPTCSFIAPGSPQNAATYPINPIGSPPSNYCTIAATIYGPPNAAAACLQSAVNALNLLVQTTPLGGYQIQQGVYGVSNSALETAIESSNTAIAKVVASVTNYLGGVAQVPSGTTADIVMPTLSGVPTALTSPAETPAGWSLTFIPV